MPRIAAVDIGSNSVRLLVVDAEGSASAPPSICTRASRLETTRLGASWSDGTLTPTAIKNSLFALKDMALTCREMNAEVILPYATAAVRRAPNREEFLAQAQAVLGAPVRVLTGQEEALLSCMGALPADTKGAWEGVLDIGGASTEWIIAKTPSMAVSAQQSMELGAVRLSLERPHADPPTPGEAEALVRCSREMISSYPKGRAARFHGVGGTITTLAAMDLRLQSYDPDRVQSYRLTRPAVEALFRLVCSCPLATRCALRGLPPTRAGIIPAGTAILIAFMDYYGLQEIFVSDRDNRHGVIMEHLLRARAGA